MLYFCVVLFSLFMSVMPVAMVVLIRNAVLHQRQTVIRDLAGAFKFTDETPESLIPSFEFVKFKYLLEKRDGELVTRNGDYSVWHWILSAIPLSIIFFLVGFYVSCVIARIAFVFGYDDQLQWIGNNDLLYPWIIVSAYFGSHVRTFRDLFRAVNNFDLSPGSFIDSTIDNILSFIVSLLLYFGVHALNIIGVRASSAGGAAGATDIASFSGIVEAARGHIPDTAFAIILITAFAFSYYPNIARRNINKSSKINDFKTEDDDVFAAFKITPIEVIDGIDSDIRDKLSNYHIDGVQNLAAANPLMLYVETPYGVYQLIDWVSQAQLFSAVGAKKVVKLWSLGVRTIFDLERFALDRACQDQSGVLLKAIGKILFEGSPIEDNNQELAAETIVANINSMLESSHVHRLRQIVMTIGDQIGGDAKRLRPIPCAKKDG